MNRFPSEISGLIGEYKDSNQIRITNGKLNICDSSGYTRVVPVRNNLWTITIGPMIYTGAQVYRCYIIHTVNYDIENLPFLLLSFYEADIHTEKIVDKPIISISNGLHSLTVSIDKSLETCKGIFTCECRLIQGELKSNICSFCHHERERHCVDRDLWWKNYSENRVVPYIFPHIYGNEDCLIIPIYYYGYNLWNIMSAFYNQALKDYDKAYNNILQRKMKDKVAPLSFVPPKDRNISYYFPSATTEGERIYISLRGKVFIKKGQKTLQEIDISTGIPDIRYMYYLFLRLHQIIKGNISHYPDLMMLEKRIVEDSAYRPNKTIIVNSNWLDYSIDNTLFTGNPAIEQF